MQRYSTVDMAVTMVFENFEANHITYDEKSVVNRVYSWYSHSDVTDPEILAACALMGKDWFPGADYDYMLAAKNSRADIAQQLDASVGALLSPAAGEPQTATPIAA